MGESRRASSVKTQGSRAGYRCERKSSRSREDDSTLTANLVPKQIGVQPKSKDKGKDGKDDRPRK